MSNVWRINLKTGAISGIDPREFCLNRNILGVGWAIDYDRPDLNWEIYHKIASNTHKDKGWSAALNAIINRMQVNDLCWTRNQQGLYYLGRITSAWRYLNVEEYKSADVVNIRNCEWHKIGTVDAVPGRVVNSFIPPRTVQKIDDNTINLFSKFIYNSFSINFTYNLNKLEKVDIYSLLSSEDCEDILGIYLQNELSYFVVPSTCKSDTVAYEYTLINKSNGRSAVVQVKNGYDPLNADDYVSLDTDVFLFTTKGQYLGISSENIKFVDPKTIEDFVFNNKAIMPKRIQTWITLFQNLGL